MELVVIDIEALKVAKKKKRKEMKAQPIPPISRIYMYTCIFVDIHATFQHSTPFYKAKWKNSSIQYL